MTSKQGQPSYTTFFAVCDTNKKFDEQSISFSFLFNFIYEHIATSINNTSIVANAICRGGVSTYYVSATMREMKTQINRNKNAKKPERKQYYIAIVIETSSMTDFLNSGNDENLRTNLAEKKVGGFSFGEISLIDADFLKEKHHRLYIDVICSNQGVGGGLIMNIVEFSNKYKIDIIKLSSVPSAVSFYYSLGFRMTSPDKSMVPTPATPDLLKQLEVIDAVYFLSYHPKLSPKEVMNQIVANQNGITPRNIPATEIMKHQTNIITPFLNYLASEKYMNPQNGLVDMELFLSNSIKNSSIYTVLWNTSNQSSKILRTFKAHPSEIFDVNMMRSNPSRSRGYLRFKPAPAPAPAPAPPPPVKQATTPAVVPNIPPVKQTTPAVVPIIPPVKQATTPATKSSTTRRSTRRSTSVHPSTVHPSTVHRVHRVKSSIYRHRHITKQPVSVQPVANRRTTTSVHPSNVPNLPLKSKSKSKSKSKINRPVFVPTVPPPLGTNRPVFVPPSLGTNRQVFVPPVGKSGMNKPNISVRPKRSVRPNSILPPNFSSLGVRGMIGRPIANIVGRTLGSGSIRGFKKGVNQTFGSLRGFKKGVKRRIISYLTPTRKNALSSSIANP